MSPPTYHGACEMCGALHYWRTSYAPRDWRHPENMDNPLVYARLECDHVMSKHAPLWREERPKTRPTTTVSRVWP